MRVSDFDFELPPERIALRPAVPREAAKLLVVGDGFSDFTVGDLPSQLRRGDVLVFNNTKVIPAALTGIRVGRGEATPKIEALLHMRIDGSRWKAFAKPGKKLQVGDRLRFGAEGKVCLLGDLDATVEAKGEAGEITLAFDFSGPVLDEAIDAVGQMPLPPYIEGKRATDAQDATDYQTMFAKYAGAVAAPTAGLHFTPDLMKRLEAAGITAEFVTLHVGAGTFLPVKVEDTRDHKMHAEWGEVSAETVGRTEGCKAKGRAHCGGWDYILASSGEFETGAFQRNHGYFHYAGLQVFGGRCADQQFSFAAFNVCSCWYPPLPAWRG